MIHASLNRIKLNSIRCNDRIIRGFQWKNTLCIQYLLQWTPTTVIHFSLNRIKFYPLQWLNENAAYIMMPWMRCNQNRYLLQWTATTVIHIILNRIEFYPFLKIEWEKEFPTIHPMDWGNTFQLPRSYWNKVDVERILLKDGRRMGPQCCTGGNYWIGNQRDLGCNFLFIGTNKAVNASSDLKVGSFN